MDGWMRKRLSSKKRGRRRDGKEARKIFVLHRGVGNLNMLQKPVTSILRITHCDEPLKVCPT